MVSREAREGSVARYFDLWWQASAWLDLIEVKHTAALGKRLAKFIVVGLTLSAK